MIELSVDQERILGVVEALRYEDDGKALRRDLAKNMRQALEPAKQEVRAGLMGMSDAGLPTAGPPLRTVVLRNLRVEVRLTGRTTGARLRIKRTPGVRGFTHAPKRLNSRKGWRHPVFGNREVWVQQTGEPEYFDRPTRRHRERYAKAVMDAVHEMSDRIRRRA